MYKVVSLHFRLKKKEKFASTRRYNEQQRSLQKELQIQKRKERAYNVACRLELSKLVRQEERRLKNVKRKEHVEWIRQRNRTATEIARRKAIATYTDWKKKDKTRRKAKDKRLADNTRHKQNLMEERYYLVICWLNDKRYNSS